MNYNDLADVSYFGCNYIPIEKAIQNLNDLSKELSINFIEYAVAVNTDRAIPDARDGLKPVAKRILYGTYFNGYSSGKPHVKCASIVGRVMADWHPHGDSSIYEALVRLAQPWTMRYPLIDFHGNMGNQGGDGPASSRYTEARLAKISEDGMLSGIKKKNVDFIPNYSETEEEPVVLPSIFPNLLCNPNSGIGVAMACNWAPHNLTEVEQAIYSYLDGKEPMLPGPDFPTGGEVINANDVPNIMRTGKGSVKVRARYRVEGNNIIYYEIPYGIATEDLMNEIGKVADEKIPEIAHIRDESNKKGFRLVVECERGTSIATVINKLFKDTRLETSFSYNQVALINKTPTDLNLKDCIKIYVEHNVNCIKREATFDINKTNARLNIVEGLLKALEDIDNIIKLIKSSKSSSEAKEKLMKNYSFNEEQAKAILDMKLGKLANLEKLEIANEKAELLKNLKKLNAILSDPISELRLRLKAFVNKYGDKRKTILSQLETPKGEDKELAYVAPEECVVIMSAGGSVKKVPKSSFRAQNKGGKGVKTQDDITLAAIRTNTVDNLLIFSDKGKLYRLLVDKIPTGTNASKGVPVGTLIKMPTYESVAAIYSQYRGTDMKYLFIATKNGQIKKTALTEFATSKGNGSACIKLREDDDIAAVTLMNDEQLLLITEQGMIIRINSDITPTGKTAMGVRGIGLKEGDRVAVALPIRDPSDDLAVFSSKGQGKRVALNEFTTQGRGGKGVIVYKPSADYGNVAAAQLVNNDDTILAIGDKTSICVKGADITKGSRTAIGTMIIKGGVIQKVTKV